ncbi:MAG: hypothetical protein EAZ74_04195 [Alphaproteobacteria bacterium]|nr:MAG: hypothetical protein EAZ74_04195 [Alphaproteobacteria bacterium]TAF40320.1 MAG: hypothetical protein EAZ66_03305 [Alphaproteobacteria bacterium]TAF74740.1 MAG: hypothetical protein EAZ52_08180 [Alphaproteobacteria bacterium]
MATRHHIVRDDHVTALNMIDLEYYHVKKNGKGKQVYDSWIAYLYHLSNDIPDINDKSKFDIWEDTKNKKFITLLKAMSDYLKYNFTELELKNSHYSPSAYWEQQADNFLCTRGLANIVSGITPLKIQITLKTAFKMFSFLNRKSSSFPRRRESSKSKTYWIPAFAGMTPSLTPNP